MSDENPEGIPTQEDMVGVPIRFPYIEPRPGYYTLMKKQEHCAKLNYEVEQMRIGTLAQVRTAIRQCQLTAYGPSVAYDNGYKDACADILAQIKTVGKGKKTRVNRR